MQVRLMQPLDLIEVAALSEHLGYPTDASCVAHRFKIIDNDPKHGLIVAQEQSGTVIGWVHIYGVHLLETDGYAEIGGLVVHAEHRRRGAGRALMVAAEQWAQQYHYNEVRLRSGLHRTEAHLFYQRIGYTLIKTSHMFHKSLTHQAASLVPGNDNLICRRSDEERGA